VFSFQISKQHLQTVKDRFLAFLNGETQIVADEAFINAVQSYYEVRLILFINAKSGFSLPVDLKLAHLSCYTQPIQCCSKVGVGKIFYKCFYSHQCYIYLINNTEKAVIVK